MKTLTHRAACWSILETFSRVCSRIYAASSERLQRAIEQMGSCARVIQGMFLKDYFSSFFHLTTFFRNEATTQPNPIQNLTLTQTRSGLLPRVTRWAVAIGLPGGLSLSGYPADDRYRATWWSYRAWWIKRIGPAGRIEPKVCWEPDLFSRRVSLLPLSIQSWHYFSRILYSRSLRYNMHACRVTGTTRHAYLHNTSVCAIDILRKSSLLMLY